MVSRFPIEEGDLAIVFWGPIEIVFEADVIYLTKNLARVRDIEDGGYITVPIKAILGYAI